MKKGLTFAMKSSNRNIACPLLCVQIPHRKVETSSSSTFCYPQTGKSSIQTTKTKKRAKNYQTQQEHRRINSTFNNYTNQATPQS